MVTMMELLVVMVVTTMTTRNDDDNVSLASRRKNESNYKFEKRRPFVPRPVPPFIPNPRDQRPMKECLLSMSTCF
jgi:hypothetical protein